ncbi:MAG: FdtA/QdtA family cupin domain-containing protein [Blastocatellia bacterium]
MSEEVWLAEATNSEATNLPAVRLLRFPLIAEPRGSLSYGQYDEQLPFIPFRYFIVFDVPDTEVRGNHAHKSVSQTLICVKGSCVITIDDGRNRDRVVLDRPDAGVFIPPLVWATQQKFSGDAVLMVLSSEGYDPDEYIRDYDEFMRMVEHR